MNTSLRLLGVALAAALLSTSVGITAAAADTPDVHPDSLCSAGWYYRTTSRGADQHAKVGPTQSDYNGTATSAVMTLTATKSGKVSSTVTGGGSVDLSVELATVKHDYSISVTASTTVTLGNEIQITVPAHKTGNGDYGAWRAYVKGVEEYFNANCAVTKSSATVLYSPYRVGWRTWIS